MARVVEVVVSHGRTFYRCGYLQSQCRCFRREGHVERWLDYPCPAHPDVTVRLAGGDVTVQADGRVPPNSSTPFWGGSLLQHVHGILADRDRLIDEARD